VSKIDANYLVSGLAFGLGFCGLGWLVSVRIILWLDLDD
jgi:hypothetical protein